MYEEYFGLSRPPFRITPDTSLFYEGGRRGDILAALAYAVQRGEGIIKVVGEVGSGKTMLCRMLQQVLPKEVEIIYIANPSVSPEDILFVIASELNFDIDRDASKHELVARLQDYLLQRHAENKQVVLFVEEAQGMPLETLEEIRLLSNLETDQHKLLQIILFGQPELDDNLSKKSIRQLRERITHEFKLAPLDAEEIHQYLNFRMREVGYTGPELINRKLAKQIAHYSEGLLRRVNILADKMLLAAYAADTHTLTPKHLKEAVADSGFTRLGVERDQGRPFLFWLLLGAAVLLAVLLVIYRMAPHWLGLPAAYRAAADRPPPSVMRESAPRDGPDAVAPVPAAPADGPEDSGASGPALPAASAAAPKAAVAASADADPAPATPVAGEMTVGSKKNAPADGKLDKVDPLQRAPAAEEPLKNRKKTAALPDREWLRYKLERSREWLKQADRQSVSIQVMMRNQAAADKLVSYLRNEWPLDMDKTRLFAVSKPGGNIFRVFYGEYPTVSAGQQAIQALPAAVKANAPYLHSIYRMQKQLLYKED